MSDPHGRDVTIAAFMLDYECHLTDVDGLAPNSRKLHLLAVRGLLKTCFALGNIRWHELRFSHVAVFLMKEFKLYLAIGKQKLSFVRSESRQVR